MKTRTPILFATMILILCQGCTRYTYVPNAQNVPLIKEKNEFRSTVTTSELHLAYGVTDNVGVMVNGQRLGTKSDLFIGQDESSKRRLLECGVGLIHSKDLVVMECYGGIGTGKISFDESKENESPSLSKFSSKFRRIFIQPSIGVSIDNFEAAFSLRLANVQFYDKDADNYTFQPYEDNTDLNKIDEHSHTFVEPAFTIRAGFQKFKLFLQVNRVAKLSSDPINYRKVRAVVGLHFNFAGRYKKVKLKDELDLHKIDG